MANKNTGSTKTPRSPKKPKTKFGRYCKELRHLLRLTLKDVAHRMGLSQPYITQIENGSEKLTFEFISKCVRAYTLYEPEAQKLRIQFELMYEFVSTLEKVELDLSQTTVVNRERLNRLFAALLLNDHYPYDGTYTDLYWNPTNGFLDELAEDPARIQYDVDRIISRGRLEVPQAGDKPRQKIMGRNEGLNAKPKILDFS